MSDITDAQTVAIYNAKGQALPSVVAPKTGDASIQSITSGTAFQVSAQRASRLYLNITTAAALKIEIGPDSTTAIQLQASQSSALGVTTIDVPAGWYVKITGTTSNYLLTAILV